MRRSSGRDDDIRRLIERLEARRAQGGAKLITLLGSSGSGKSSLLRPGAVPDAAPVSSCQSVASSCHSWHEATEAGSPVAWMKGEGVG
jgi:ABC-type lipoprotein export system ATPase subunit